MAFKLKVIILNVLFINETDPHLTRVKSQPIRDGGRTFESCQSQREARRKTSLIIFKAINQFKIITDTIRTGVNGRKNREQCAVIFPIRRHGGRRK